MSAFERKDYTARDYDSLKAKLIADIQVKYPTLSLDFATASVEALQADFVLYPADSLHYYIDAALSECFPDTAVERQNLASLGKLNGYTLTGRSAALAQVTYTYTKLNIAAPNTVTISKGTSFASKDGLTFTNILALNLIAAGGDFNLYQGVFATDSFAATSSPGQRFTSTRRKVAQNVAVSVTVAGTEWTQVSALLNQGTGQYYMVQWNGDGSFTIIMGDGVDGDIPSGTVTLEYFITDGASGCLDIGRVAGDFKPHAQVRIDYSNATAATGGVDEAAIEDIRAAIPAYGAAQARLTALPDYQSALEAYPGVLYAALEYDPVLRRSIAYLLADGYGSLSEDTLAEIDRYFFEKYQLGNSLIFKNVEHVKATVALEVALVNSMKHDLASRKTYISDMIDRFFEPQSGDTVYNRVGKPVRLSDFYEMLSNIEGVAHTTVSCFTREPQMTHKTWSDATGTIYLPTKGWGIRPAVGLTKKTPTQNRALVPGVGGLQGTQIAQEQRISRVLASTSRLTAGKRSAITRVAGGSYISDDWQLQPIIVPIDRLKITLSNANRRYAWGSWYQTPTGEVPTPFQSRDAETGVATAHFVVTHTIDGVEYPDSAVGYVGKVFEVDSGAFMFQLEATYVTPDDPVALTQYPLTVDTTVYTLWKYPYRHLRAGGVKCDVTTTLTTYTLTDDGYGGLLSEGVQVGYIDYDTGDLLLTTSKFLGGVTAVRAVIAYYLFPNRAGEVAEIILSPYVGDIPVGKQEFCTLSDVTLEVTYE